LTALSCGIYAFPHCSFTDGGYSSFSGLYGPDAFCKLLVRDVKAVCMHVYGLPDGQMPKHAGSLDEIRASRP
jgi:hypothetical protein